MPDHAVLLRFLLPRGSDAISGGNLYNAGLLSGLERIQHERISRVERSSIEELALYLASGESGIYLLDTLDLKAALALERRAAGQRFGLVVHHLPSLEPGIGDADPMLEVERRALGLFDFWVATSDFTKRLLVGRGFPADRVLAVRPGLALGFALPSEGDDLPQLSAISVGNLIPRKGACEFLSALAVQVKPSDRFELAFVGRADADRAYAARCRALLAGSAELAARVTFRGEVPHADMPRTYARASLVVSASKMETFGIALQEARAHGVPILALDCGNAAEHVVRGENGILAASFDELATHFLELSRAPAQLSALRAGARSGGECESWDAVAARFVGELGRLPR